MAASAKPRNPKGGKTGGAAATATSKRARGQGARTGVINTAQWGSVEYAAAAVAAVFLLLAAASMSSRPSGGGTGAPASRKAGTVKPAKVRSIGRFDVVEELFHDNKDFTQGLLVHNGYLYQSTGMYGESEIQQLNLTTGEVLKATPLDPKLFGEGITISNNELIMLTWREKTGLIYDPDTLALKRTFTFTSTRDEGWGITTLPGELAMSDGGDVIHFWDPVTLEQTRTVSVKDANGKPIQHLNELEYLPDENVILANIWYSSAIIAIDPASGEVVWRENLQRLRRPSKRRPDEDVLNGIAYNPSTKDYYFTGKKWYTTFRARLRSETPKTPSAA